MSTIRGRLPVLALALCLVAASAGATAVEVTASVDRDHVAVGETLHLTIEISGSGDATAPDLGTIDGFDVRYLGPSSQVSIVNGRLSSSIRHRYQLVAERKGRFTLGPFELDYGGKRRETAPITVEVADPAATSTGDGGESQSPGLRLVVVPKKTEAWVGERLPVTVKLYVGRVHVDQVELPKLAGRGFSVEEFAQPWQKEEVVAGRRIPTLEFESALTPLKPGVLSIGPATVDLEVLGRPQQDGFGDPFFNRLFGNGPFGGMFSSREPFEARSRAVPLRVRSLPERGRPDDFSGAVGRFELSLAVKPTKVAAGDPVTVRMSVSGDGDLSGASAPKITLDDRFRAYDPEVVRDRAHPGVHVFEEVVVPKEPSVSELPVVRFSFFDPEAGRYRTLERGPVPLEVRPAPQGVEAPEATAPGKSAEKLGHDIVYIKDSPGPLRPRGSGSGPGWGFALAQCGAPLLFFGAWLAARRRQRLAGDPRLARFRKAGREARRALAAAERQTGDGQRFYDGLTEAMSAYLAAKLDLPPGGVDAERVAARLDEHGAGGEAREPVRSLFALLERKRYAGPASSGGEREEALTLARTIVERLEHDRALESRFGARWIAALSLLAFLVGIAAGAEDLAKDPRTAFFEGNTAYRQGRYLEAASAYEHVAASGLESAALFFNLGNAYFKQGEIGRAVLEYERAERLAPRDADVQANLSFAREEGKVERVRRPLWRRLLFPLADRATGGELAVLVGGLWWTLWGLLAARRLAPRLAAPLGRAVTLSALLLAFALPSLGARSWMDATRVAVVTGKGETAVRYEPSPDGTEYFRVREGADLEVTAERDGWLQVRRGDGRRGWIPAAAVTEVAGEARST